MNPSGISQFNQARIEWAIRLKYSPMPTINMEVISSQLNAFRIGDFRQIGKTWEVMMERDGELAVNSDKRKSDAAGLEWQIVSDGSLEGDRHAAALQYFYENLTATEALEQDATGGADELIYQVCSALDYRFSIHEMLLRVDNAAAREVTAEFRHSPLWFFECRRGYLGYMPHIFDLYGVPCVQGEWLTAVNMGWMRSLCLAFVMKMYPLRDWLLYCTRYGSGFLEASTDAAMNSPEWNQAQEALLKLANDGVVLHSKGVSFNFLEQSARNALPFHPIVEMVNGLYAKCYRGVDLATGSRNAHGGQGGPGGGAKNPAGASVQKEESGIFLTRDAKWVTGVFNERIDRPAIRFLFDREPRAWFVLMPPLDDTSVHDLAALQGLVPMGFRVKLKEVYKRFRWSMPEPGEPCLGGDKVPGTSPAEPRKNGAWPATALPPPASSPSASAAAPIAAGADPARNPGLAAPGRPNVLAGSRQMPLGQDPQMPSLGYAIPNAARQLEELVSAGLGRTRAAQALRWEIIHPRETEISAPVIPLANSAAPHPFPALHNDQAGLDADGWALIAPFGNHPKTRVFRADGRLREQKFIQVLDDESAEALVNGANSLFRKLKRALVGIPVYRGHGDLADHDPQALAPATRKIKLGVVDKIRKSARGIEAHFALDHEGAAAVAAGWKLPSAFWLVSPIGLDILPDGQTATRARPFKLLSVALTPFPNISGVESLANARPTEPAENRPAAGSQPTNETSQTNQDNTMKQLMIGWLAAQGIALANDATESAVFDAFHQEMRARASSVAALGNEKNTLAAVTLPALARERDDCRRQAAEAAAALAHEQAARLSERRRAAAFAVDLAIQRGRLRLADRDAKIAALENSAGFDADARTLLDARPVIKTEAVAGKQRAALDDEARQTHCEYEEAFAAELLATGQNPVQAHLNIMRLPKYAGLAGKLSPNPEPQ
jgi:hypothetical protein